MTIKYTEQWLTHSDVKANILKTSKLSFINIEAAFLKHRVIYIIPIKLKAPQTAFVRGPGAAAMVLWREPYAAKAGQRLQILEEQRALEPRLVCH